MTKDALLAEIMRLPEHERRELVEEVWDSLPPVDDGFQLTEEQKAELDRRWEEHLRDPSSAVPF